MNLRRIWAVASKEWRETIRDRMFFSLAFLIPILWMIVFGYGMVLDVEHIPLAILDYDHSALSRDYAYRFIGSRYFDFKGYVKDEEALDRLLTDNTIRAALIIPDRFHERLTAGRPANVQTLIDGVFPLRTQITKGYVIAINAAFSQELVADYLARLRGIPTDQARRLVQPVKLEVRYLYNQEVRSVWAIAPALVMFTLMLSAPLLTALQVVKEKERGSIYNIYSSTVSRVEFLLGKLLPYVAISAVNLIILWIIAIQLFRAPFKGDPLFFAVSSLLFILCTTGMGLILSLLVSTQLAALVITIVLSIVPTILYSGILMPVSSLTHGAKIVAYLHPAMHYTRIVQGSFLKGVGLEVLWEEALVLALYASGLLAAGYLLFHKRTRT